MNSTKSQHFRWVQIESICRWQNRYEWKFEICFGKSWKHCGKSRKCRLSAFSPLPTMFSKQCLILDLYSQIKRILLPKLTLKKQNLNFHFRFENLILAFSRTKVTFWVFSDIIIGVRLPEGNFYLISITHPWDHKTGKFCWIPKHWKGITLPDNFVVGSDGRLWFTK